MGTRANRKTGALSQPKEEGLGNRNQRQAIKSVPFFYSKSLRRNRKHVLKHKVFGHGIWISSAARLGEEELGEGAGALQGRGLAVGASGRKAEPKPLRPPRPWESLNEAVSEKRSWKVPRTTMWSSLADQAFQGAAEGLVSGGHGQ